MYDDLVNTLLYDAGWLEQGIEQTERDIAEHLKKAADAIEELELHYCPHAIRNVHDRGDDSLCGVLGTEPPKEEEET